MIRSPAQGKLEEWLLHKINLQIDTKQVIIINGVTTRIDSELG
jgi:hypothetical protein